MPEHPTPAQALILWRLVCQGGSEFLAEVKPEIKAPDRKALEQAGLLEAERRRRERPGKRATAALYLSVTDKGWRWLAEHLEVKFSPQARTTSVLETILKRLKTHFARHHFSLADFMLDRTAVNGMSAVDASGDRAPLVPNGHDLSERVRAAYRALADHQPARRVRLCELRNVLSDVPRPHLDHALLQMEREEALVLYPLDNPLEIHPEDTQAALLNSAGQQRHVLYLES